MRDLMDRAKFENTVLYLLRRCFPEKPGLTSLLKMLFYADYEHYRQFLSPITGAQYVALERGPVIDGYKELFEQMTEEGIVTLFEATNLGYQEKTLQYRPGREPDVRVFSETERDVLDWVVRKHGSETGKAMSEKTHLEGPWSLVWDSHEHGLPIPYPLFRWLDNLPDESDLLEAKEQVAARPDVLDRIQALQKSAS